MSTQTAKILVTSPLFSGPCWYAVDEHGYPYLTSDEENAALVTYEEYEAAVAKENPTISEWTWLGDYPAQIAKAVTCFYWVRGGKFYYANETVPAWNMGFGPYENFSTMLQAAGRRRSRPGKHINFTAHQPT